ncbi:sterol desaturase family protein [Sansalvadorimonas sp. 2012CJ34-2]|uniref:Sterol desaturase family protein n=1 Tax=Parendozoicomonas callyspongiae TaxID=2942213 RepID=A0ABT0PC48_9GAMM|nr:sterol desaturase family protein [Sansalvadorimonas sp. 2012CJ34-2]MCL6268616.1 sterol desaturase family protein [Sansalvadorimonas sp. 2012CJ34-2]
MTETDWLEYIEYVSFGIYEWVLIFAALFLFLELADELITRRLNKSRFLETLSSLFTQVPYYLAEIMIFSGTVVLFFTVYEYVPWKQPIDTHSIILVLFLADLTYYVEHYALHKIRLLWMVQAVHHSSPVMNTATAFRFSLFDPIAPMFFHLPLVLMGFNPILVLSAEVIVQAYQFWLHNEMIGKLGPLEWIFNTPSHHRVHHGSDKKYLDKNFGGILIVWDRLFGTFQKEEEVPAYGLTTPMTSKNPITVQFSEFPGLFKDLRKAKSLSAVFGYLLRSPGWKPD